MKMKRWMITTLFGVMALFAVAANPVERTDSGNALAQKNNAVESMKNDLVNAGKTMLERVRAFIAFAPEQKKLKSTEKKTIWVDSQQKTGSAVGPVPVSLAEAAELPQPIRKISGVLIHADQDSIDKILRVKEYRGSG